jgi:hypothetical protein
MVDYWEVEKMKSYVAAGVCRIGYLVADEVGFE